MKMYSIFKRSFTKYIQTIKNSTWAILQESEQKKTHTWDTKPCSHSAVHKTTSVSLTTSFLPRETVTQKAQSQRTLARYLKL